MRRKERFEHIYRKRKWGSYGTTLSGRGSSDAFVKNDVEYIATLCKRFDVNSIVDVCGDFRWQLGFLNQLDVTYLGVDISEVCLSRIEAPEDMSNISFKQMDICTDTIPDCDLFIVRDVLFHLTEAEILLFFQNLKKSKIRWLLTTTFTSPDRPNSPPQETAPSKNLQLEEHPWEISFEDLFFGNKTERGYEKKAIGIVKPSDIDVDKIITNIKGKT